MISAQSLKVKGWSDYEIHHALDILIRAEEKKHPKIKLLDKNIYWIFLVIAIIGNLAFSAALIPALAVIKGILAYVVTCFTGFVFGVLCATLMRSIEKIEMKHHLIYTLAILIACIVNFTIIINQVHRAAEVLKVDFINQSYILGIFYFSCFFMPYALIQKRRNDKWI